MTEKVIQKEEERVAKNSSLAPEEITIKDVNRAWRRFWWVGEIPHAMDRYIAASLLWALMPILNKLYKDKDQLIAAYQRHLLFYNTQATWGGGTILGILISMEQERASQEYNNEEITATDDAIYSIKAGLMGALAGIGDSVDEGVVQVIFLSIALPWAQKGQVIGVFFPFIMFSGYQFLWGWYCTRLGFKLGRQAATELLGSQRSKDILDGLSILGLFMMGVIAASYVNISSSLQFTLGDSKFVLQDTLDQLLPGLLPLAAVMGVYRYFRKKEFNILKALLTLTVILGVLAAIGIL